MTKEERKIMRQMEKLYGLYFDEMESVLQGCMVFVDNDLNRVYFRGWEWEHACEYLESEMEKKKACKSK